MSNIYRYYYRYAGEQQVRARRLTLTVVPVQPQTCVVAPFSANPVSRSVATIRTDWHLEYVPDHFHNSIDSPLVRNLGSYVFPKCVTKIHPPHNFYKCSAVAEMGGRLATIDMGQWRAAVPLLGEGSWVPI